VRTGELGFLNDYRRMNVAITRAKHFMWVVGNSKSLNRSQNWKAILETGVQQKFMFSWACNNADQLGEALKQGPNFSLEPNNSNHGVKPTDNNRKRD